MKLVFIGMNEISKFWCSFLFDKNSEHLCNDSDEKRKIFVTLLLTRYL